GGALEVVREPREDGRERAARLAGADQVRNEPREDTPARAERVGERLALPDPRERDRERVHERGVVRLLRHGRERLVDGETGLDERRELAGGARHLVRARAAHPGLAATLLAQLGRVDAARPQRLPRGARALGAEDAAA